MIDCLEFYSDEKNSATQKSSDPPKMFNSIWAHSAQFVL